MDWQEQFEQFWAAYPKRLTSRGQYVKLHKMEARQWFTKTRPDEDLFAKVMAGVEMMRQCVDEHYVPDAFRWLRNQRWEDEYDDGRQIAPVVRDASGLTPRERLLGGRDAG